MSDGPAAPDRSDWTGWRGWRVFAGVASAASLVISAAGLWFVYHELQENTQLRRVDLALGFVERFNNEAYLEARFGVIEPWLPYREQLRAANDAGGLSEKQRDVLVELIVAQDRKTDGGLEAHILTLAGFYDQLAICVKETACDAVTTCGYFREHASDFQALYGGVLADLRTVFDAENTGRGLDVIAGLETCR